MGILEPVFDACRMEYVTTRVGELGDDDDDDDDDEDDEEEEDGEDGDGDGDDDNNTDDEDRMRYERVCYVGDCVIIVRMCCKMCYDGVCYRYHCATLLEHNQTYTAFRQPMPAVIVTNIATTTVPIRFTHII